ncbi:MAG: ubiquinol-cytochrome c reductase iron-sulfur subunit [Gammaproteobacteria bacterium]|nr:ubiquinol-cytochrome c reductase iron-sulfur subunit [Gammaproteobacteria bacterium]
MSDDGINMERRRFLTTSATVAGGVGVLATAVPFVSTFTPSAKAKAIGAPVEVDIDDIEPGEVKIVKWQGKPVWILRRDEAALESITGLNDEVRDPQSEVEQQPGYAQNEYRSINPEYLIVVGYCTHLGCSPKKVLEGGGAPFGLADDWEGGFFCPCHGSRFDLAGRVFKDVPAPTNLIVPPHQFLSDTRVIIGEDSGVS